MIFLKIIYNGQAFSIRQSIFDEKPILIGPIELLLLLDKHGNKDTTAKIISDSIFFFVNLYDFYLPDEVLYKKYVELCKINK